MAGEPSGKSILESAVRTLQSQKRLAERAAAQLTDEQLHQSLDANTNSVAVIMKHIAGNQLSRWADFLATDGEKPWRQRDNEFIDDLASREDLMAHWEQGWARLLETLSQLSSDDLGRTVKIRGRPMSVVQAILGAISHYGYHVGQIVLVARVRAGDNWQVLTIPRGEGESEAYNRRVWQS